jgi:hypothetical protein
MPWIKKTQDYFAAIGLHITEVRRPESDVAMAPSRIQLSPSGGREHKQTKQSKGHEKEIACVVVNRRSEAQQARAAGSGGSGALMARIALARHL